MSKIIGVTVGTPLSPSTIREKLKPVTSVNGNKPNENGEVTIPIPIPEIAEGDNGKIMQVKNGVWTAVNIEESSVKTFVDEYINSALEGDY